MAEERQSLHIDTDWKKQAQEEKRKLAEAAAAKSKEPGLVTPSSSASAAVTTPGESKGVAEGRARGRAGKGEIPPASFATLVQSLLTQALYYLGDFAGRGAEPVVNLDMAKHQIDILSVLEEKTRGNLTEDEKKLLDTVLYESRMRYVSVASQYIS